MKKLAKRLVPIGLFKALVPYWHLLNSVGYQVKTGFPARGIEVIGVTGTDGKTSTSTLITQMLRQSGKKVAMMTTISVDYGDGQGPHDNPTRLTTFGAGELVSSLKKMKQQGAEYLVLEVTSHALHQRRIWGVPISVAVMTNIGHEHLDYHGTFENYRDAKRRLFKLANKNRKGRQIGIVNAEDPSAELFTSDIKNPVTYGTKNADLKAENINLTPAGSSYEVKIDDEIYSIKCHLPGSFNVYNSLAAVAAGRALGLTKTEIEKGIDSLKSVEGRMTRVDEGQDFAVIVDYAHTPESFDKIFAEVKPLAKGRLIAVFGSAGRRDEEKRAKQGAIAGKWCDVVIVTEEDDRDMDGVEIMRQIVSGAESQGKVLNKDVLMVHDRTEAVKMAINSAKKGDLVMLLGKGHEKSILYNGPKAAELRHLPQDDGDESRVLKRSYDEVTAAKEAIRSKV
ncbi:MAG: UDP-N-acetylmuramoyl-L-alanyl-D-glutamate--2,6-diaminopimelate ligase [Candidatus Saccharibacteria bacterium]|nr:UDP-N-acetylmuramoyl-L-alanyl-D-glutamate--2,6-diaminopimelate ligase [Candidatus Saccharibacteria bacterium]